MTRITEDQIRVGDTIRISEELTVTEVLGNGRFRYDEFDTKNFVIAEEAVIELVNRPLNLPTKAGSVIRVHSGNGSEGARWFLMGRSYEVHQWKSDVGNSKTVPEMEYFLQHGDFEIEVIA